jgi:hypothetical protein
MKSFLGYDGAVITKGDDRLRTFPFPTRRPVRKPHISPRSRSNLSGRPCQTHAELERCLLELTRVKVSHLTEDALRAQDEATLAALPKPKPKPTAPAPAPEKEKERTPKLSKEEELLRDKWARLLDMVVRGRLDALRTFWTREGDALGGPDALVPAWAPEAVRASTLLQLAAREGQAEVVQWLLTDAGADPTLAVTPSSNEAAARARTAYDEAAGKEVRDVFRRLAGAMPDRWDWLGAAHVPSVLDQAKEDEKEEKRKVRRKGLKEKIRERERERGSEAEPEPEPEPVKESAVVGSGGPRRLGGASGSKLGVEGLTPEMRQKVEREQRARAVEARLKAMNGK